MKKSTIALVLFSIFWIGSPAQNKIDSLKTVFSELTDQREKLQTLDDLTKQMIRKNHTEQKEYIRQYMTLAKSLEEYDLMAIKSRFLVQQHIYAGESEKALQLCDSMLSYESKFKEKKSKAHILLKKGGIVFAQMDYTSSLAFFDESAVLFMQGKDSIFAADAYLFGADAYSFTGDFVKSLKQYKRAYELYEKLEDYQYMTYVGGQITNLMLKNGLFAEADTHLYESIEKCKKYQNFTDLSRLYIFMAEGKGIKEKKYSIAKSYLDSAKTSISKIKYIKNKEKVLAYLHGISTLYHLEKGDVAKADVAFSELQTVEKNIGLKSRKHDFDYIKVRYYISKKEFSKALNYLKIYKEDLANVNATNYNAVSLEKLLADTYSGMGQQKKAIKHLNKFIQLKDSINKAVTNTAYTYHQAKFKTAEKEKEIQQLEADKALSQSKRNTLVALLLSLTLIFLGIWWRGRLRRKHLAIEIERNKEELTQFTQQLIQKSDEQEVLTEQLIQLKLENKEHESVIIIEDLATSKILTGEDWYYFKQKFTKVHPNFFLEIHNKGYQLSKSEERLVALEKLELDNNKIAKMLGISVDTVFVSRYRLRKKLNAPKEISLIEYFEKAS
jgi:tetratricopeptide (TPR) repeat protein